MPVTLARAEVDRLAEQLHRAQRQARPIPPLTDAHPGLTEDDAYEIQASLIRRRLAEGESVIGAKLGFTSRAMREALGVDHPNHGWLTDAMVVEDGLVRADDLIHPKVEPEVGFLLGRELAGPSVTAAEVLAATRAVFACLEVVDSRFVDFRFRAADNTADDSSAARVVVGPAVARPEGLDMRHVGVALWMDGELVTTGAGAAAAGHPLAAVAWLARDLHRRGAALHRGSVVISGGLTAPADLRPGTVVRAEFAGLGVVSVHMEG